jgi:PAS domain S-box
MVRAIDASLVITSSAYGFIGLVSDDESKLVVHAWSEGVMKNCTVPSMPVHFNISGPFVWGECIRQRKAVIINNFDDYPAKHGFPGGHVAIDHFMAVPVFDMGRIVAMCAVANKEEPYTSDDAGTLTTLGNTVWEIMHRKQSAEALRKREAQLLEAQRLARLGNIDYDVTGNYLSLSDEGLRILGIQAEEFQGTLDDYYSRIHPDDLDQVKTMYTTCIESGGREIFEHRILRPGGEERYVQVRFRTVKEPGGTVTYCSGTIQDITDRKLTEKQLEVSILRITQNLEQMAILNDQIRNPLSVITAITDLEDGQYKQKILSAVREINDLITRLDQGWLESDKVRKFLKTHYGFYEESG